MRPGSLEEAMEAFDPRITPARPDLAAKHLEGRIAASHYVEGRLREVVDPQAPVRLEPSPDAELKTEALKGERVTVYETTDEGWCWGQLDGDGYVGWMPANALVAPGPPPTHRVAVPRTLAFPGPSIKLPPVATLSLGAKLTVTRQDGAFAVTRDGWYLPHRHLGPLDANENDFVAVAERFVGTPYLWGGKSSFGIDCSGLVQVSLNAAGTGCPRDSDMQQHGIGRALDAAEMKTLQRGDLIFWKGHVAIVRDGATIVHANAHHMATVVENIREAIARIKAAGSEVTAIKRLG